MASSTRMTLNELASVPAPAPTKTWRPIAHGDFALAVYRELEKRELEVTASTFEVGPGGGNMFGTLRLARWNGGRQWMLGLRNSTTKRYAAGIAAGIYVLACANGEFHGDLVQVRKHTSGILEVLERFIGEAIEATVKRITSFIAERDRLAGIPLTEAQRNWALLEAVRVGAVRGPRLIEVLDRHLEAEASEVRREFPQFADRFGSGGNAYQLLQAVTRTWRGDPGPQVFGRSQAMNEILDTLLSGGRKEVGDGAQADTGTGAEILEAETLEAETRAYPETTTA